MLRVNFSFFFPPLYNPTRQTMNPLQSAAGQKPSRAYLQLSIEKSIYPSQQPKKQLLILDLNGTLISRMKCGKTKAKKPFYARPHYQAFLDFIFKHFEVMVWSSARQQNVERMCHIFTEPLKLVWSRSHLQLSQQQFHSNTDTIKDLDIVWKHFLNEYNATNTIVIDDSPSKLVLQPYNLIHIRTFNYEEIHEGYTDNELLKVMKYLDTVRLHSNIANHVRSEPFLSHLFNVPENIDLDLAMRYFNHAGQFGAIYQPPKKGLKRQRGDHVVNSAIHQDTQGEKLIKQEPEDHTAVAQQEDADEEPSKKKLAMTKTKKEKPPRHLRKPRHKKQRKAMAQQVNATSNTPIRPQTEKKLKSIQESIKQRKQEKLKAKKELQHAVNDKPQTLVAIKVEP